MDRATRASNTEGELSWLRDPLTLILADYQDGSTEMGIDEVEALAKLWISLAQEIRTGTYQSEAEFARIKEAILREQAAGDPM